MAKDTNSRLLVLRSRLLTRNAPITNEFPNTIIKARMQKKTIATTSTWGKGGGRGPALAPVPFVLFVAFVNVLLFDIAVFR